MTSSLTWPENDLCKNCRSWPCVSDAVYRLSLSCFVLEISGGAVIRPPPVGAKLAQTPVGARVNPRTPRGGVVSTPPWGFFEVHAKRLVVAGWNFQYPLGQPLRIFCRKKLIGSCQVTELWRHKRYSLRPTVTKRVRRIPRFSAGDTHIVWWIMMKLPMHVGASIGYRVVQENWPGQVRSRSYDVTRGTASGTIFEKRPNHYFANSCHLNGNMQQY